MSSETELYSTLTVRVERFRDESGRPTCYGSGKCLFFETSDDVEEKCSLLNVDLQRRAVQQGGTIIPHKGCPIWGGVER